jgi:hypothetical protein
VTANHLLHNLQAKRLNAYWASFVPSHVDDTTFTTFSFIEQQFAYICSAFSAPVIPPILPTTGFSQWRLPHLNKSNGRRLINVTNNFCFSFLRISSRRIGLGSGLFGVCTYARGRLRVFGGEEEGMECGVDRSLCATFSGIQIKVFAICLSLITTGAPSMYCSCGVRIFTWLSCAPI